VVCHRGVVAWLRTWRATPAPAAGPAAVEPAGSDELVGVLASMALAAIGG
jgi:hypothetical protein